MKAVTLASITLALLVGTSLASAEQKTPRQECGAPMLEVVKGKVSISEDGKRTEIDADSLKPGKTRMTAARTSCRSGGGYTVCSNGRYGCVWSDRSEKLLGCGAGI